MVTSIHQKTEKQKKIRIAAKRTGLIFAIIFSFLLIVMAAFPMGKSNTAKDYIDIAIYGIYPLGLFLGLKWQGLGGLICIAGFIYVIIKNFIF